MPNINEQKYKSIILFFANKVRNGTLGKLKLMKLLYYLDFDFYEKYGKSVSGDQYLRFENGPVPRMAEKMLKLMNEDQIKIRKVKLVGYNNPHMLIEPLQVCDISLFTKEEVLMMTEIADKWEKFTGTDMKNATHGEAPWIATEPNDVIDYNLAYYRNKFGELDKAAA